MGLMSKASGGGGSFDPVPMGTHIARCVTVVDLGIQETTWSGEVSHKHQVYIAFEVPEVRVEWEKDGEKHEGPALIGSTYTNSIGEKANLGKLLTSWRGKTFTDDEKEGFDLFTIIDIPCQLSVTHNTKGEKTYANIASIMGLPKGMDAPARETDLLIYSPGAPECKGTLPEWLQKKCEVGHNRQPENLSMPPPVDQSGDYSDFEDSIPF